MTFQYVRFLSRTVAGLYSGQYQRHDHDDWRIYGRFDLSGALNEAQRFGGNRSLPTSLCGEWPALSGFERFE